MKKIALISTISFGVLVLGFALLSLLALPVLHSAPANIKMKDIPSGYCYEIPVILYHNIDGAGPFSVSSKQLDEHFRFFRDNNVTIVSLGDLATLLQGGIDPDKKYAIISFDDGYPAMKDKLLPIAAKYSYPVSLFVYTDYIGVKKGKLLSWDDLRQMDALGLQIESHSVSHADLLKVQKTGSKSELYRELYLSKRIIELMLNRSIDHFAFPYGSFDRRTLRCADAAGYKRLYTTEFGANIAGNNNVVIKRHHVKRTYTLENMRRILHMK